MRRNRTIELAGVNAFRTLVEAAGHIYQPVNLENDIGKDGYLDVTDEDGGISTCVAVQIKSGLSYRHGDNYKIPAPRAHGDLWSSSPLPVIGVVYDPDREQLLWVNLTHELRSGRAAASGAIVVPATNVLTATTLRTAVVASATAERRVSSGTGSLTLYVADQRQQIAAVWDHFAIGRHDGRALLLLRDATRSLTGDPLRAALRALAHLAPYHPDIWWHESNIVPEPIRTTVGDQLQWPADDLARFLDVLDWDEFSRGLSGQDLCVLLCQDPDQVGKLELIASGCLPSASQHAEAVAATLLVALVSDSDAPENARDTLRCLLEANPPLAENDVIQDVSSDVAEWGVIALW